MTLSRRICDITNKELCTTTHPYSIIRWDDPFSMHYTAQPTLRTQNCRTTPGILILPGSEEPAEQQHTSVHQSIVLLPLSISSTNCHIDCIHYITNKLQIRLLKILFETYSFSVLIDFLNFFMSFTKQKGRQSYSLTFSLLYTKWNFNAQQNAAFSVFMNRTWRPVFDIKNQEIFATPWNKVSIIIRNAGLP